jgi:hypothetical protein
VTHPCKASGWTRAVRVIVVAKRRRLRGQRWIPLHKRVVVYLSPTGEAFLASKVDQLWRARPRGANAEVLAGLLEREGAQWLCVAWNVPGERHGVVWLRPAEHVEEGAQ